MYRGRRVALIVPARNEAESLPSTLTRVPDVVDHVIVVDNGSRDGTSAVARSLGATVVHENIPGYGNACQAALRALERVEPDIVAFADGDGSNNVEKITTLLDPLIEGRADLVLERRIPVDNGALTILQRCGNYLVTKLIQLVWGHRYRDLGPMRAMVWSSLKGLNMRDRGYGWTVEMQVKALKHGMKILEIALPYRKRVAGKSKVSGNVRAAFRAGLTMGWVVLREAFSGRGAEARKTSVRT